MNPTLWSTQVETAQLLGVGRRLVSVLRKTQAACVSRFNSLQVTLKKVVKNPFSQNIQNKHDIYFKYIRYHDLKQKKKSVEFVLS